MRHGGADDIACERDNSMTNREILAIAMRQSAIDSNCRAEDFQQKDNKVAISTATPNARKYLDLPLYCDLVSYGSNIVASVDAEIVDFVTDYINKYDAEDCFETPALYALNAELVKNDMRVCFMAEYFLPDVDVLLASECDYTIRIMEATDFASCYTPQWSNALCNNHKDTDMLAAGAFDGETLVGLAGCSADCDTMWQIGIDVLPAYRRRGIASALTSRLALEVLERGKVPFYCAAWSNIKSVRNAIKGGFRPAWVQLTAKSNAFIEGMDK